MKLSNKTIIGLLSTVYEMEDAPEDSPEALWKNICRDLCDWKPSDLLLVTSEEEEKTNGKG